MRELTFSEYYFSSPSIQVPAHAQDQNSFCWQTAKLSQAPAWVPPTPNHSMILCHCGPCSQEHTQNTEQPSAPWIKQEPATALQGSGSKYKHCTGEWPLGVPAGFSLKQLPTAFQMICPTGSEYSKPTQSTGILATSKYFTRTFSKQHWFLKKVECK